MKKSWILGLPLMLLPFALVPSSAHAGIPVEGCIAGAGPDASNCTFSVLRPVMALSTSITSTDPFDFPSDLLDDTIDPPDEDGQYREHFINDLGVQMTDFHIHWDTAVLDFDFFVDPSLFDVVDLMYEVPGVPSSGVIGVWFDTLNAPGLAPGAELLLLTNGSIQDPFITINASIDVPEPGTLAVLGFGIAGLGFLRRRQAKA